MQMMGKMNSIIIASQTNMNARAHCEKYFMELKELIEFNIEKGKDLNSLPNVLNPPISLQKGVRNIFNSVIEKKCDQVKWRKAKKLSKPDITLPTFNLSSLGSHVQHLVGEGSFTWMSLHSTYYFQPSNKSSVFMPIMTPRVLQQFHADNFHANAIHNDKH
ncbi:hypothetical protein Cgig2_017976 [Carnegiea gigantea]|uniref:Uncharacterized protein n=1 Tax=Carnegiea gigantea TaxID=171969 RepID=A0A9Q1JRT3_9CARY|nr:hypothetical protein Cgig2_017976 [Carnegiea gigantea]